MSTATAMNDERNHVAFARSGREGRCLSISLTCRTETDDVNCSHSRTGFIGLHDARMIAKAPFRCKGRSRARPVISTPRFKRARSGIQRGDASNAR